LEELPVAVVLQGFQDIRGDLLDLSTYELPRVGLEYLPPQGDQETGKLYFAWGEHYEDVFRATHGWAELDLSDPQTAGLWYFGKTNNYSTNDYIFAIDPAWAEIYTPGLGLVSGRYRDGGWSGQGPALFAYGPWNEGDPPQPGATIFAFPLLLYGSTLDGPSDLMMDNYHHSDEWNGGAWLTAGDRTAVIFVGTKGIGEYWYGFSNGVVWPDEAPFPEIPDPPHDNRGWWSNSFQAQMIFYDPSDLARVATGQMVPSEPQPYAVLDLDDFMFELEWDLQKYRIGPVAYDREHGLLYILELFGDGDKPLVHVFRIGP
jgi:hypothetical protein